MTTFWVLLAIAGLLLVIVGIILVVIAIFTAPPPPIIHGFDAGKPPSAGAVIDFFRWLIGKFWRVLTENSTPVQKLRLAAGFILITLGIFLFFIGSIGTVAVAATDDGSASPTPSVSAT